MDLGFRMWEGRGEEEAGAVKLKIAVALKVWVKGSFHFKIWSPSQRIVWCRFGVGDTR